MRLSDSQLVTVAVPSHNHGRFIEECIEGILVQEYRRIELIVIDDGSSDDSVSRIQALVERCRDRFERFEFVSRENRGLCTTLNEALAWAQGQFFVVADSDDTLLANHIATLITILEEEPEINGVYGGAIVVDERGRTLRTCRPKHRSYSFTDILSRDKEMVSSGGMVRTAVLRSVGGYPDNLYIEDWYMMLKLTELGSRLKTIPTLVVRYRVHNSNSSKNVEKMLAARLSILSLYSTHVGHTEREALVFVEAALDNWRASKVRSLRYLRSAVSRHAPIAARSLFWSAVSRLITPAAIIDLLKERPSSCQ